jgi:hypothetical protein
MKIIFFSIHIIFPLVFFKFKGQNYILLLYPYTLYNSFIYLSLYQLNIIYLQI